MFAVASARYPVPNDAPRRRPHARRLASSPPSDSVEGYRRARVERVNCVDIPDPGPNQNFRSARGHVVSYTRVLTATLCTVTDGLDRLLPIVASATVSPRLAEMNRSYDVDAAGGLDEYYYEEPAEDSLEDSLKDHLRWVRVLPRHQPGDGAVDDIDADTNAREPLHAAYRYIRNCLHPARHPDVIKARRQRSKLATDFEGSPSLDNFVAALGTMPPDMIRARFASNHTGHYGDDWGGGHYDPLELLNTNSNRNEYSDHSEGYWALRGVVETDTLEAIEYFDRCFYGYAVSEVPAPVAPPPLRELRMAPRAVEELVLELENVDAWGVHVRVDLSVGHPGYEARMWGWWPADDTECMLCEVELTVSDREWPFASGNGVGVEAILGLCAAMKHDLPVYVSAEVIDLLSVHPDGWKPSFAVNQPGYDVEHVYTGRDTRYRGFFYTPENGDDLADPRLFDVFLRFLRNQFGGGRMLRVLAPYHNGEGPATSKKPSPPNLADALLKGPAAFFFEIIKTWATWRHRWHGFALYGTENASPALSSQTGFANVRLSLMADASNDRHGGFDPRARSALAAMRRDVARMSPEEMRDAREGLHAAVRAAMGRIDAVSLPTGRARLSDSPSMASLRLQLAAMDGRWEECARWRDALGAMNVPCVDYTAVYGGEEAE